MGFGSLIVPWNRKTAWAVVLSGCFFVTGCFGGSGFEERRKTTPAAGENGIELTSVTVPLKQDEYQVDRVGPLLFRGGLILSSEDRRFGGFSGLRVTPDGGTLTAVSDNGYWFRAQIEYNGAGNLIAVKDGKMAPILQPNGKRLTGKIAGDAEGLERLETDYFVSFEQKHRVWRYADTGDLFKAVPVPVELPSAIQASSPNKGLEGIAIVGGRLVLMTEHLLDRDQNIRGWIGPPGGGANRFQSIAMERKLPFQVTDLATLPSGDLLVLERRFSRIGGIGMRLRRIARADLDRRAALIGTELVQLDGTYTIDNMEGLATRRADDGRTLIYILSDDNYNPIQRTLLLMFELSE